MPPVIEQIIKDFEEWAALQKSDVWYIEFLKNCIISDVRRNVEQATDLRDKIYFLKSSTDHFAEEFEVKIPEEISKRIFILKSLNSF